MTKKIPALLLVAAAILALCSDASAQKKREAKRGIYVVDAVSGEAVVGATVRVYTSSEVLAKETRKPHGLATFTLPLDEPQFVVEVVAAGYQSAHQIATFSQSPGIDFEWIWLQPLGF